MNTPPDTLPASILITEFHGTCEEAFKIIADPEKAKDMHPVAFRAVMEKAAQCQADAFEQNKTGDKDETAEREASASVAVEDTNDDKLYYGVIKGEDLKKLKELTGDAAIKFGQKVFQTEPFTGTVIILTSAVAINSFYNAALKEDPTLILAPMALPGVELTKVVSSLFGEEGERWAADIEETYNKYVESFKEDLKDLGKSVDRNPLWVANPAWAAQAKVVEEAARAAQEAAKKAGVEPEDLVIPGVTVTKKVAKEVKKFFKKLF